MSISSTRGPPSLQERPRTAVNRTSGIRKAGDLCVVDLVVVDGEVAGAVALHVASGSPVRISAKATIVATGGLTRLYRRNSASTNMGGDGYALALRAGASLIDMELVQFFPIGHLAPRLIGMDPIMSGPVPIQAGRPAAQSRQRRVHLTLRHRRGRQVHSRPRSRHLRDHQGSRGWPWLAAWRRISELRAPFGGRAAHAFGPVIDRLAANGIDLTKTPVEVAPIAHYHMGGIVADVAMATEVPGLFAAGEAVGGANGANRLSGNAITEAFVFGRQAGRSAAARANGLKIAAPVNGSAGAIVDLFAMDGNGDINTAEMIEQLQATMADDVGPFRDAARLTRALSTIDELDAPLGERSRRHSRRIRHAASRLARSAQHAAGRTLSCAGGARPHGKPRRPSA